MDQEFYSLDEIDIRELDLIDSSAFQLENFLENLDNLSAFDSNSSFSLTSPNSHNSTNNISSSCSSTSASNDIEHFFTSNNQNPEFVNAQEQDKEHTTNAKTERKKISSCDKPPEPYADIIAKAILSNDETIMQLKDIYNFMIENYENFTSKVETSKWKSAIRHNLSSQKFFIKTCKKNAQGHYWTIESSYAKVIKEKGSTSGIGKLTIKSNPEKLKLRSKSKLKKAEKSKINTEILNDSILTGSCLINSPTFHEHQTSSNNISSYNDSAFFSSNDNDNSQTSLGSSNAYKFLGLNMNVNYSCQAPCIDDPAFLNINTIDPSNFYYYNYSNFSQASEFSAIDYGNLNY